MKKIFLLLGFTVFVNSNAQQSYMIIENYSSYDYWGVLIATALNGCYPQISNTYYPQPDYSPIIIPAGTNADVGYYNSGSVVPFWDVQSSITNPIAIRPFWHSQIASGGAVSNNTDWQHSKFEMRYPGTTTNVPFTGVNISSGSNACYTWPSSFYNSNSPISADWFTISSGATVYSYLQIF